MLSAFDVTLLIVSLAGYVFLFLKLRQAEQRTVELRERVEKVLHGVDRMAVLARPIEATPVEEPAELRALTAAEDARDQISAARADVAELKAYQNRGFGAVETRVQVVQAEVAALREALAQSDARNVSAAEEIRRISAKQAAVQAAEAAAAADAELARKRLRMFP